MGTKLKIMNTQSPIEYLETLRANLRHFEENQDFGDFFTVQKIRQMLEKQIAEAESVLGHSHHMAA